MPPPEPDDIEFALSVLMDTLRDTPLTSEDIRRETINFVCQHVEDVERAEVVALYDSLFSRHVGKLR